MTGVVALGALCGVGVLGTFFGLRAIMPSLAELSAVVERPNEPGSSVGVRGAAAHGAVAGSRSGAGRQGLSGDHPLNRIAGAVFDTGNRWSELAGVHHIIDALAICGETTEVLVARMLGTGGVGFLLPPLFWLVASSLGASLPTALVIVLTLIAVPTGVALPVVSVLGRARERRRHFRIVLGNVVDLVVLSLAGGVGVESALLAACDVSTDWAARRMSRSLAKARDAGQSPWEALSALGEQSGVVELTELAATLQLAGKEGARVRQSLSARSDALRRHELAESESTANAMTERLFLPGALLLIGFLLFVGYPAFSRILGGL